MREYSEPLNTLLAATGIVCPVIISTQLTRAFLLASLLQPSNDSTTCMSNQCMLLTHLYQLFGKLLGCSRYNSSDFPAYAGDPNMYRVHKFMYLNNAENTYFITQVGGAAAAYGVSRADVSAVGTSLTSIFNRQCSVPTS